MGPPLQRIRRTLSTAQAGDGSAEIGASIQCVDAIQELSRCLLDVSLMEFGIREQKMAACDVSLLAERVLRRCRTLTDGRAVHLLAEPAVPAFCDAELTERVLTCLVWNALRFASAERPVTVRVARAPSGPMLSVRDSGPAPTAALLSGLTGSADAAADAARDRRASGLPLRFCRLAAAEQNALLALSAGENGGCEFQLALQDVEAETSAAQLECSNMPEYRREE
jgi:K+-sensing histidine kinase KdpD